MVTLAVLPSRAEAQRLAPQWSDTITVLVASALSSRDPWYARPDSGPVIPRTYWLEGGLIVGIPLAILGVEFGGGLCESHCTRAELAGAVIGATIGFTVGSLIGGQIRKGDADSSSP